MTRLHILSDLHLEFGTFECPIVDADVTILAGDIYTKGRCGYDIFDRPTIMVAGNHEFYSGCIETTIPKLKQISSATILDNEECFVENVRFLGCTLWTDFNLFANNSLDGIKQDASFCVNAGMNDFRKIRIAKDGYRKFNPKYASRLHANSVNWLKQRLSEPFSPTVVVTHHAPSLRCIPIENQADRINCAYASHLDWLIEEFQPDLWIWGHVHESVPQFKIGNTKMISNPRGYAPKYLNSVFDPSLVVDI